MIVLLLILVCLFAGLMSAVYGFGARQPCWVIVGACLLVAGGIMVALR